MEKATIDNKQLNEAFQMLTQQLKDYLDQMEDFQKIPEYLNKKDTCNYLGISNNTLNKFIDNGLPKFQSNGVIRFHKKSIDEWVKRKSVEKRSNKLE